MRQLFAPGRLGVIFVCFAAIAPDVAAAPEAARLDGNLSGENGKSVSGVYIESNTPTSVVKWPGTWTAGSLAAGTPCATYPMYAGTLTTMVIHANGNYRRCAEPPPAAPAAGPERARLSEPLSGNVGTQAAAVFVNSGTQTSVVKWPGTLTPDTTLAAGTRCSSVDLAAEQVATHIIQVHGDYRKCVDPALASPETARVTEPLSTHGTQVAAVFVSNGMPTFVVKWPATYSPNTALKAGTPCSSMDLAAGQETTKTIQASGNYRRCM